jgi:CheY-like chemotaxis protein
VLHALKADSETRHIPVFIVSVVDARHKGLSLGAADYLLKPVNREDLLTSLTRCGVTSALRPDSAKSSGRAL